MKWQKVHSGPVTGQKYKNQSQNFNVIMVLNNYIDIIKQFKTVYILKILMNILYDVVEVDANVN